MKAAAFYEQGGPEVLQITEVPIPEIGPNDVLVRVKAVALNHLDLWVRRGMPGLDLTMPHVGGSDIAGVIDRLGKNVRDVPIGQRIVVNPSLCCGQCEFCVRGEESLCLTFGIVGEHTWGGCAEYVAVPADNIMPIPDNLTFEEAASVPLVFQTAWRALIARGGLRAGEDILIQGASGGAASAAIQIAKLAGARVFAVTSGPAKVAKAKELGADVVIDRSTTDFFREVWRMTNKRGVDLVLENVGQVTWKQSLRILTKGGRLVTYGATTGPSGDTDIRQVFWKQIYIIGSTMSSRAEFTEVMNLIWQGKLRPVVDRVVSLEEIREAHQALEAGKQFGKIVLSVGDSNNS